jgi:hypothetical protein
VDPADLKKKFRTLPIIHLTIDTEHNAPAGWKIKKIEKR